ncbi:MAG: NAD(P)/FAD-dependent oxidoreductase [Pseudomonadota bacterium]
MDDQTGGAAAPRHELAIVGGGIAGLMLASAMARNGVKVLVLESGVHPKFAIGESMILETSEIMRSLAMVFDTPELEYFSAEHFTPVIGGSHGVKRHFSYIPHRDDTEFNPADIVQAVIPKRPYGHELHLYRQDSDYFYLSTAVKYGATVLQKQTVVDIDIRENGVSLKTAAGEEFEADYVIDAGGFRSLVAEKFALRRRDLRTHTRGLFTHMVGVRSLHEREPSPRDLGVPFSFAEGTLHHVFEGGWIWVIPFNNHREATNDLCSVGLLLDPRIHGPSSNETPQEEFDRIAARFPSVSRHLEGARPVRDWVRADRLQYASTEVVGDRWCLLGHAAGFIDPLFSKGLYTSLASVLAFGRAFLKAREQKTYTRKAFAEVERVTLSYVASNDRLVANAIKSFAHADLWRVYSVIWILGAYLELVRLTTYRQSLSKRCRTRDERLAFTPPELRLVGGGFPAFDALSDEVDRTIEALDMSDPRAVQSAVDAIRARILKETWIPHAHRAIARGARALPRRKFSWRLFMQDGGVMGRRDFRDHFFADTSLPALATFMMRERFRYSRQAIGMRHRKTRALDI